MICYLPEGESQPLRGLWFVENGWIEDVRPLRGRRNTGTHDATNLRPLRGRNFSYQSVRRFSKIPISILCKKGWLSLLWVISI